MLGLFTASIFLVLKILYQSLFTRYFISPMCIRKATSLDENNHLAWKNFDSHYQGGKDRNQRGIPGRRFVGSDRNCGSPTPRQNFSVRSCLVRGLPDIEVSGKFYLWTVKDDLAALQKKRDELNRQGASTGELAPKWKALRAELRHLQTTWSVGGRARCLCGRGGQDP